MERRKWSTHSFFNMQKKGDQNEWYKKIFKMCK